MHVVENIRVIRCLNPFMPPKLFLPSHISTLSVGELVNDFS